MSTKTVVSPDKLGKAAMLAGGTVGGAVVGAVAQSKVNILNTTGGKIGLIALGVFVAAKAKSDVAVGAGLGLAASGASSVIKSMAGGVQGIQGLMGVNGEGYGVGDVVEDEYGQLYMVNGMGEYEPIPDEYLEDEEYLANENFAGVGEVEAEVMV